MEVRRAKESDIDSIMEIEGKSFSSPWTRENFYFEIKSNLMAKYLLVEDKGRVLGYIGLWFMLDEAHIVSIGVDPEERNKGVASMLMEAGLDLAESQGMVGVTLEVRVSNEPAKNLYFKFGFIPSGIRPNYYQDNQEDAIIMWKYFKDV